jgi:hypothetical protein
VGNNNLPKVEVVVDNKSHQRKSHGFQALLSQGHNSNHDIPRWISLLNKCPGNSVIGM